MKDYITCNDFPYFYNSAIAAGLGELSVYR